MLRGRKWIFPAYTSVLMAFTAYVLLNTFAISKVYAVVQEPEATAAETVEETGETAVQESIVSDIVYIGY